jgi:hypothetical protein
MDLKSGIFKKNISHKFLYYDLLYLWNISIHKGIIQTSAYYYHILSVEQHDVRIKRHLCIQRSHMTNELHATLQLAECDGHQSINITSCFCGPINGPTVLCTDFLDVSPHH